MPFRSLDAPDGTVSVRNAAARLGVTEHHVRLLVRAGRLRTVNRPDPHRSSRWRLYARDVDNYRQLLEGRQGEPAPKLPPKLIWPHILLVYGR